MLLRKLQNCKSQVRHASSNVELKKLAPKVQKFIEEGAKTFQAESVYVMNGSKEESHQLTKILEKNGQAKPLKKFDNCWLVRTDPADVARVESKTVICTQNKRDTIPTPKEGVKGMLGYWLSPDDMQKAIAERFPGCMKGRTMYAIPYSMGPVGSPLSKIGIELTDSPYVALSMGVMTRVGSHVLKALGTDDFIRCSHSVGQPLPSKTPFKNNWPCNPDKTIIAHIPDRNEIVSFGSGYGGNSLLGKKCFSLRLGSILARKEGWLAEHMLILCVTNPQGKKKYMAAAFPSACGKTNLAMMTPTLPGYKIHCVGDDIAWMRFDSNGQLRAINPEYGFFGVAPGTSMKTNPNAMLTIKKNTIFTNTAETSDGGVYWEGIDEEVPAGVKVTSWLNEDWAPKQGKASAHPNSRFCAPASQCPIIDPDWESPHGVPIDAILFGGRRPEGVPLVYESFNWRHSVFIGASMRSEATAAAEFKDKAVMHDPFAMRPFFGYNFGQYLDHWLSFEKKKGLKLPRIFHVNWFRRDAKGGFLWPGYGENSRVLDWICRQVDGEDVSKTSPIGYVPKAGSLNTDGLKEAVDFEALFSEPKDFWLRECDAIQKYFDEQLPDDLPEAIGAELHALRERLLKYHA